MTTEILEELCPDDPWTHSTEGLDDQCLFCGSYERSYRLDDDTHFHDVLCPWMKAMDHLGREHPNHFPSRQWNTINHGPDGIPYRHCLPRVGYRVEMVRGSLENHIYMVGHTVPDGGGLAAIQGSTNVFDEPDDMPYLDSKNRMHYRYLCPVPVFPGLEAEAAAEQVAQD